MFSDSDDESVKCPICNKDISVYDEVWRQVHFNSCLSRISESNNNEKNCPICHASISHLSFELATAHINSCLDKRARDLSSKRSNDRCPLCGMDIRNLDERKKVLHSQICQASEHVSETRVIRYDKQVEDLETPIDIHGTIVREPVVLNMGKKKDDIIFPVYGKMYSTEYFQNIDTLRFRNI